jgi:multidrug/hemolysin transport system permease protein
MSQVIALVARNLVVFLRNRTALLFACVPPVVLWIILLTFVRGQTVDRLSAILVEGMNPNAVCDAWVFSSAAILSAFSSTAAALTVFINDRQMGRYKLFLGFGAKSWHLYSGYLLSSIVVSFVISLVLVLVGQIWALAGSQPGMSLTSWLVVVLGAFLGAVFFTGFNALAMTFIQSVEGVGAHCLLMGTLTGVLTYSFVLPQTVGLAKLAGVLPFAQAAALLRAPMLAGGIDRLASGGDFPADGTQIVNSLLGATIQIGSTPWALGVIVLVLTIWSVILLALTIVRMTRILRP